MYEEKNSRGRDEGKLRLAIIVDDTDRNHVIGFASDVPLAAVFAALLKMPGAPEVDIRIRLASEMGIEKCDHPECNHGAEGEKRRGKMDPTLRARTECPQVIAPVGELGSMLSILSEKIAGGGR